VYEEEARRLQPQLWTLRELDGAHWHEISRRLGVPEPRLAKIRLAALEIGIAVKQANGRIRWLPPEDERVGSRATG
jgi:hypothetical protein